MFISTVVRYIPKQWTENSKKGKGRKWGKGNTPSLWAFKGLINTWHCRGPFLWTAGRNSPPGAFSPRTVLPAWPSISLPRKRVLFLYSSIQIYLLLLPFHRSGQNYPTVNIQTFGSNKYCNFFLCPLKAVSVLEKSGVRRKFRNHQNLPSPFAN